MAGTKDIADAVGLVPATIRLWVKQGLLPPGEKVHRGRRGTGLVFPEAAIAQAQWVKAQLDGGRTIAAVLQALQRGEYPPRPQAGG